MKRLSLADDSLIVLLATQAEIYRLSNEIFFAHIASGEVQIGGASFTQYTLLTLANLTRELAVGTMNFFGDDGAPLPFFVEGLVGATSTIKFEIAPERSVKFQTLQTWGEPESPIKGWARVMCDRPLRGSSIFQLVGSDNLILFEAGVSDSPATGQAKVFVQREGTISTGIALANPLEEEAIVIFRLLDSTGTEVGSQARLITSEAQLAQFIEELFPASAVDSFEGTLVVSSDIPIVITALRTQSGFQMSSYPVGQVVR